MADDRVYGSDAVSAGDGDSRVRPVLSLDQLITAAHKEIDEAMRLLEECERILVRVNNEIGG